MLGDELIEKIKKLSWIKIFESRNGFIKGDILKENGKKQTNFFLFYEKTYFKISFGNNKEGLKLVNFISKEIMLPYLKITHCSFIDLFTFFKNKLNIYMWEADSTKFNILYQDYSRIIEKNKGTMFGYKNIQLLIPPAVEDKNKRRSI